MKKTTEILILYVQISSSQGVIKERHGLAFEYFWMESQTKSDQYWESTFCLLLPNSQQAIHRIYQLCNATSKAVHCSYIHFRKIFAFEGKRQHVTRIGLNSGYHCRSAWTWREKWWDS